MKLLQLISLSSVIIYSSAAPLNIFNLFRRVEVEDFPVLTPRAEFSPHNSSNSTGLSSQNSTAASNGTSKSSKPSIKIYSFSSEFTQLYGNNTTSSNSGNLTLSTSEISNLFDTAHQGPKGNINATTAQNLNVNSRSLLLDPSIKNWANVSYEEIANVSSANFNSTFLVELYNTLDEDLSDESIDGAVIVQDPSNLEETAFFLDLVLNSSKPTVLTKQATTRNLITDGASNLYDAILTSASKEAHNRGTIVVSDKRISSGFYAKRVSSNSVDTILSNPQGLIGSIYEGEIQWYYEQSDVLTSELNFTLSDAQDLPEVYILQNYQGFSSQIINALSQSDDIEGLVIGTSDSSNQFTDETQQAIDELSSKIPIVLVNDQTGGTISKEDLESNSTIAGGILDPVKAKILLQVALASDFNSTEIKNTFSSVYGG